MYSITLTVPDAQRDDVIAELWEAGTSGITEDNDWLRAFFEDESAVRNEILSRFAGYRPVLEEEEQVDWVAQSRQLWRAFPVGRRFWLAPEWDTDPAPDERLRLPLRPGMACGSGMHAATQLCLQAMETRMRTDAVVLDVGSGSGILAEAAALLRAGRVYACDIEHEASVIARQNLTGRPVHFFTGSLRSVRAGAVDVAVANLNATTLAALAPEFKRIGPDTLIVSGFPEHESAGVAQRLGRVVVDSLEQDGWACLIF